MQNILLVKWNEAVFYVSMRYLSLLYRIWFLGSTRFEFSLVHAVVHYGLQNSFIELMWIDGYDVFCAFSIGIVVILLSKRIPRNIFHAFSIGIGVMLLSDEYPETTRKKLLRRLMSAIISLSGIKVFFSLQS